MSDLTADQLFFVAWAQVWCSNVSPKFERLVAALDEHAPARIRVNGTLANVPEFARAFACEPGTEMNPEQRCEAW